MSKPTAAPNPHNKPLRVVIRPLPKVVFFYLTWIASLVCALAVGDSAPAQVPSWTGIVWMSAFLFNLIVISFDFNEERTLIAVLAIVAAVLALLYTNVLGDVGAFLSGLRPQMNATFYWMVFIAFSVIFLFAFLRSRFDYWIIEPNEAIHRFGVFPKLKRFPTDSLRWDKVVPDILERILLGSGTIILTMPQERNPVVLHHVVGIGRIDDQMAAVLSIKQVTQTSAPDLEHVEDSH